MTNAHMVEVLQWGYDNGKFSTSAGDHNGLDTITAKQLTNIETGYNANPKVLSLVGPGKALDDTGTYLLGI